MERGEIKVAFKKIPAAAFALVFLLIACSIISEHFWTGENLFNLGLQGTVLAILALAQTMVILSEGIDLSSAHWYPSAGSWWPFLCTEGSGCPR